MEIKLRGHLVLIDEEDAERVLSNSWYVRKRTDSLIYFYRVVTVNGRKTTQALHRFIMNESDPQVFIDHANGHERDNRKANLRRSTVSTNTMNQKRRSTNKTGFKGVSLAAKGLFRACITVNRVTRHLGYFPDAESAAAAYAEAAKELHGEFMRLS